MLRLFSRVQLAYVGLFFAACMGVFYYQSNYIWPIQRCEQHGGWWSDKYHECATPAPIWRFTGRKPAGAPAGGAILTPPRDSTHPS